MPAIVFQFHIAYNRILYGFANRYAKLGALVVNRQPKVLLEIGVWRGDRAALLIEAALRSHPAEEIQYFGFDLFEAMNEELARKEISRSTPNPTRAEVERRLAQLVQKGVRVRLISGNTKSTLPQARISNVDLAFIDGGHSYETVKNDWHWISNMLAPGGCTIFDDFVNKKAISREGFGVNRLVAEIDRAKFEVDVLKPRDWWPKSWGVFKNQLVLVTRRDCYPA